MTGPEWRGAAVCTAVLVVATLVGPVVASQPTPALQPKWQRLYVEGLQLSRDRRWVLAAERFRERDGGGTHLHRRGIELAAAGQQPAALQPGERGLGMGRAEAPPFAS